MINTAERLRVETKLRAVLLSLSLLFAPWAAADYSNHPQAEALVDRVAARGVDREWLQQTLSGASRQESILKAISRPAEKSKPWADYQDIFLTERRTKEGIAFWSKHEESLNRVSASTGVPAEIIVASIGVETYYGRIMGSYRVIDALSTLAFDYPRRSKFFTKELEVFLELAWASDLSIDTMKGSYAGAMGLRPILCLAVTEPTQRTLMAMRLSISGVIPAMPSPALPTTLLSTVGGPGSHRGESRLC